MNHALEEGASAAFKHVMSCPPAEQSERTLSAAAASPSASAAVAAVDGTGHHQ